MKTKLTQSSTETNLNNHKHHYLGRKRVAAVKRSTVVAGAALIIAIGFFTGYLSYSNGVVGFNHNSTTFTLQGVPNGNGSATPSGPTLPLQVNVINYLTGSAGAGVVTIYNQAGTQQIDTQTLSSGTITSTIGQYTPGEALSIQVNNAGANSIEWYQVTVPSSSSIQQSSTVYSIRLNFFTLGTYGLTMSDQLANTYAGASCFNMTAGTGAQCGGGSTASKPGAKPSTLFIQTSTSVSNTGYTTSYDPVNAISQNALLVISGAGAASIQGCGQNFSRGGTFYCVTQIPDASLTCHTSGQNLNCPVSRTGLTINPGTLTHGTSETETIKLYFYANTNNFLTLGSWGPNAFVGATTTIKIGV